MLLCLTTIYASINALMRACSCINRVQEHKFFDSADWALNKEAAAKSGGPAPEQQPPQPQLPPKLEPTPLPARRISHLDSMEK